MKLYRQRISYVLEDYLGLDRRYEIAQHTPGNLLVSLITNHLKVST